MNCMKEVEDQEKECPFCGEPMNDVQELPFLPFNTVLADRYIIGKKIEENSEGFSYVGFDKLEKVRIYVREFFPSSLCLRQENSIKLEAKENLKDEFLKVREKFLDCFRSVAKFRDFTYLVSVYDIFEENGTAYIVMEWVDGIRLDEYVKDCGGSIQWEKAKLIFMPLLSSLIKMESYGIRHLGICPENLFLTPEKKLKLVGFSTEFLRSNNQYIEPQLYSGYSAIEQYREDFVPCEETDVYGFMASLFFVLTGEPLARATRRVKDNTLMVSENLLKEIPENVISSLASALRLYKDNRTSSFENIRLELSNSPVLMVQKMEDTDQDDLDKKSYSKPKSKRHMGALIFVFVLILLLLGVGLYFLFYYNSSFHIFGRSDGGNAGQNDSSVTYQDPEPAKETVKKINAPNLVGKNYKTLQEEISKDNQEYSLALMSEDFSDEISDGCIISQNPPAGENMLPNSTIAVTISKGPQKRKLPEISGKTISEAAQLITEQKLIPVQVFEYNSDYQEGTVVGYKNHSAGDTLESGSEVTIIISRGVN